MTPADEVPEVALLTRQLERERRARRSAEDIGEAATADLWQAVRRLEAAEAELRADAAQLQFRQRLAREMQQQADPLSVMELAVRSVGSLLDATRCLVFFADQSGVAPSTAQWRASGVDEVSRDLTTPPAMAALAADYAERHASLVIADINDDPRIDPVSAAHVVRNYQCRGFYSVPLKAGTRMLGWLSLQSREPRAWDDQDCTLIDGVATDLSSTLLQVVARDAQAETVRTLREVATVKSEFVATVSHELRTPLASINGYLEMLLDREFGDLNAEQVHAIDVALRNSERLQTLVDNLLTLSRSDDDPEEAVGTPGNDRVDLVAILEDAGRSLAPSLDARGLVFALEADVSDPTVPGDHGQLQSVVLNLLNNAEKFSPDGATVRATLRRTSSGVTLEVADTGHGIQRADLSHVFRRFFRTADAGDRAIPGSGLGLSVVKTIVEQHGGRVSVESTPGEGTTFTVALPG